MQDFTFEVKPIKVTVQSRTVFGYLPDGANFSRYNIDTSTASSWPPADWNKLNPGDAIVLEATLENDHRDEGVIWSTSCDSSYSRNLANNWYRFDAPDRNITCTITAISALSGASKASIPLVTRRVYLNNIYHYDESENKSVRDEFAINTDYGETIEFSAWFYNDYSKRGVKWTVSCSGTSYRRTESEPNKTLFSFKPPTTSQTCNIEAKSGRTGEIRKIKLEVLQRKIPNQNLRAEYFDNEKIHLNLDMLNDKNYPDRQVWRRCDSKSYRYYENRAQSTYVNLPRVYGAQDCTLWIQAGDVWKSYRVAYKEPKINVTHSYSKKNRWIQFNKSYENDISSRMFNKNVYWYSTFGDMGKTTGRLTYDHFDVGDSREIKVTVKSRYNYSIKTELHFKLERRCTSRTLWCHYSSYFLTLDKTNQRTEAAPASEIAFIDSLDQAAEVVNRSGLLMRVPEGLRATLPVLFSTFLSADAQLSSSVLNYVDIYTQTYSSLLLASTSADTGSTPVREETSKYDRNNLLEWEMVPATSGEGYSYGKTYWTYEHTPHNGNYAAPKTVKRTLYAGGSKQYHVTDTYNTSGLLISSERTGTNAENETETLRTAYTYHSGEAGTVYRPNPIGEPESVSTGVRQFGDLVKTVKVSSGSAVLSETNYTYDIYSNPVVELHKGAFVSDVTKGSTPATSDRVVLSQVNGFGQTTWQYVGTQDDSGFSPVSKSLTSYNSTGEVRSSWVGTPSNETAYTYISGLNDAAGPLGYLKTVSGPRSSSAYTYDDYGRVETETVDGEFEATYTYDTLNRVVREDRHDEGRTHTHYHKSGAVSKVILYDPKATHGSDTITTEMGVDALGRVTSVSVDGTLQTETTYDAFDRPLSVTDHRLAMLNDAKDQTSHLVYDDLGNLVKEYGAVLHNKGGHYTDSRRPYAEYVYDVFGRRVETRRLLEGTVTVTDTATLALSESANVAIATTTYDAFDRPVKVKDPEGFTSTTSYDRSSNLIKQVREVWNSENTAPNDFLNEYASVTTQTAYDAAGRPVKVVDPRGYSQRTVYDLLGNVTDNFNQCGVLTHHYEYTVDGLLTEVWEPALSDETSVSSVGCPSKPTAFSPNDFTLTKAHAYGSRTFPSTTYTGVMDDAPDAASERGAKTSFTYDYAGRVLTTTLPSTTDGDGNAVKPVVTQTYDARGNLLKLTDAKGFVTSYTYDAHNRMAEEHKEERVGSTVDAEAFPKSDGLITSYTYDAAGNLTQEERGEPDSQTSLLTTYAYNSLGKVVAESRPHTRSAPAEQVTTKLKAYRLDGAVTAQTSYHYEGSLTSQPAGITTTNRPSVTQGNVTVFDLNKRGEVVTEVSEGHFVSYKKDVWFDAVQGNTLSTQWYSASGISSQEEHHKTLFYDGLGRKVKRVFTGDIGIYAEQNRNDGTPTGSANYKSYWRYDPNSNLTYAWDTLPDGAQGYDSAESRNTFEYRYTPTNLERYQKLDVRVRSEIAWEEPTNPDLGMAHGEITTRHNTRNLPYETKVKASTFRGTQADTPLWRTITTTYSYYANGSKERVDVASSLADDAQAGYQTYTYDARGRVVENIDSNGQHTNKRAERTVTLTSYAADGTIQQELRPDISQSSELKRLTVDVPTVGGFTHTSDTEGNDGKSTSTSMTTFNSWGQAVSVSSESDGAGSYDSSSNSFSYTYDLFGNVETEINNWWSQYTYRERRCVEYNSDGDCTDINGSTKRDAASSKKTTTYTVNLNNDVTSTRAVKSSRKSRDDNYKDSSATTNYVLDSRGNRLSVGGTKSKTNKYYGYAKRYDADGNAAEFDRAPDTWGSWQRSYHLIFRHDPYGNQVLSADAGVSYKTDNPELYSLERRAYGTFGVQGDVELIVRQQGKINNTRDCVLFWCSDDEDTWDNDEKSLTWRNETFSLADGRASWAVLAPFDAVIENAYALEAPTEAISDRLGVIPFDVTAPENALPDLDVGDVTPPEDTGEVEAPEGEASESGVSTFGITSFDLEQSLPDLNELPNWTEGVEEDTDATEMDSFGTSNFSTLETLPNLSDTSETTSGWTQTSGETFELQAPESVLPESLNATSASEVIAPEGDVKLPPDVGSPSDVLAPGTLTPPNIGAAPSDSATDVLMPKELQAPAIPEIGNGTPNPVGAVTPPEGWTPNSVGEEGIVNSFSVNEAEAAEKQKAKELKEFAKKIEKARKKASGDKELADQLKDYVEDLAYEKLGASGEEDVENINNATEAWDPAAQLMFTIDLGLEIIGAQSADEKGALADQLEKMSWEADSANHLHAQGLVGIYDELSGQYLLPDMALRGMVEHSWMDYQKLATLVDDVDTAIDLGTLSNAMILPLGHMYEMADLGDADFGANGFGAGSAMLGLAGGGRLFWRGSGPVPGVLGVDPNSTSVGALRNYYPRGGGIEFVYDPNTNTFAVGKPKYPEQLGEHWYALSPHEQLARAIDADRNTVVGGIFHRGANGEIFTDEWSGHFGRNWTPEVREQFQEAMEQYDLPVIHNPWR